MKILFISHNAKRAGAQLMLLQYLRWLKINKSDFTFDILLFKGGDLIDDFKKISNTYLFPSNSSTKNPLISTYIKYKRKILYYHLRNNKYNLIYSNTIMNGYLLNELSFLRLPVVTHVHEMQFWINNAGINNIFYIKKNTNYFLTASKAVNECLKKNKIAEQNNLECVNVFVDINEIITKSFKNSLKNHLSLSSESIIIAACGSEDFRKGKDLFIPIAISVLNSCNKNNIHFVWIGGSLKDESLIDLELSGYKNQIHFISNLKDANKYFKEVDIFMMLSREDPFPTVNLEVGIWSIPIICFKGSGGSEELLENDCGIIVPYGDINLFSNAIINLLNNPELRQNLGRNLSEKIINNFTIDKVAMCITSILEQKFQ